MGRELRRGPAFAEPAGMPSSAGFESLPADLDDAAILEATSALDLEESEEALARADPGDVPVPLDAQRFAAGDAEGKARPEAEPLPVSAVLDRPRAAALPAMPAGYREPMHELGERGGATAPQLRRFIKSRAYVPMHELRRRFGVNGSEDDVTPIDLDRRRIFVGLPPREGTLLGELLRAGDIGFELSLDPIAPIVVGVFPMRPVPRS